MWCKHGRFRLDQLTLKFNNKHVWPERCMHCVQRELGGLLTRTNVIVYDRSCSLPVKLLPSLPHVCLRCCYLLYEVCPILPDACASLSVSAWGLGGTHTLAFFMVCEEDLIYDPLHPWLPKALMQSDLWGVLQHLKESENKTAGMKGGRKEVDSLLAELLLGFDNTFAVNANNSNLN